jgi:hypothetical protein
VDARSHYGDRAVLRPGAAGNEPLRLVEAERPERDAELARHFADGHRRVVTRRRPTARRAGMMANNILRRRRTAARMHASRAMSRRRSILGRSLSRALVFGEGVTCNRRQGRWQEARLRSALISTANARRRPFRGRATDTAAAAGRGGPEGGLGRACQSRARRQSRSRTAPGLPRPRPPKSTAAFIRFDCPKSAACIRIAGGSVSASHLPARSGR